MPRIHDAANSVVRAPRFSESCRVRDLLVRAMRHRRVFAGATRVSISIITVCYTQHTCWCRHLCAPTWHRTGGLTFSGQCAPEPWLASGDLRALLWPSVEPAGAHKPIATAQSHTLYVRHACGVGTSNGFDQRRNVNATTCRAGSSAVLCVR